MATGEYAAAMLKSVRVPKAFEPPFERAERFVEKLFSDLQRRPEEGGRMPPREHGEAGALRRSRRGHRKGCLCGAGTLGIRC
jgi:hypothetical protein